MATNELPTKGNKRGGAGWWMDLDGVWRSPEDWPGDNPPADGWVRGSQTRWSPPDDIEIIEDPEPERDRLVEPTAPSTDDDSSPRLSRQAKADRRAMFTVAGVVAGGLLLLVAVLVLITGAGAEDLADSDNPEDSVIIAAETDAGRAERLNNATAAAPGVAQEQLSQLPVRTADPTGFDPLDWVAERTDCLDMAEQVLVARSAQQIVWADNLECVPDRGSWTDRYLGTEITRTLDAEVSPHVPAAIAYASGGDQWTAATRQAYLVDVAHPATLQITAAGSGHNPRKDDPAGWKPSVRSVWCAYAVDWITVKARWEMSVSTDEVEALSEMLDTCSEPESSGADEATLVVDQRTTPTIKRLEDLAE